MSFPESIGPPVEESSILQEGALTKPLVTYRCKPSICACHSATIDLLHRRVSQTRKLSRLWNNSNDTSMAPNSSAAKAAEPSIRRRRAPAGVSRGDSEDELGSDDAHWEWIYNTTPAPEDQTNEPQSDRKRRKVSGNKIVGARVGQFECHVGDCVLLKADGSNEAWVALICEFVEDDGEGEKAANFMWFSTEKEIRNKDKKRSDFQWVILLHNNPLARSHPTDLLLERALCFSIMGY